MSRRYDNPTDSREVPFRALLLSVLAFAVPMMGVTISPEWVTEEQGILLWLTALLPPFLLTYYKGWEGASVGLAAGMAALVMSHLAILVLNVETPNFDFVLWITATYIAVCVGAGFLGELLRRERRAAEEMALTDALTGLPNRRHATVFLDAAFSAAARGQPVSVVIFDIDDFKPINDRFGHRTGDQVLRRFGAILTEVTRRMDISARWGGEEFVSVLSRCKAGGAASFTKRVQDELRADVFPWGKVTISAGIAEFEPGMGSPELLLAAADRALYAAKDAGKDQYHIAGTHTEVFADIPESTSPTTQRGSLRLESVPRRGFQLVPAPKAMEPEAAPERSGSRVPPDLPGGSGRILVVDDDAAARNSVAKILEKVGYEVVTAPDGESALATARTLEGVDLLISDLIMPGMSGFTLVEQFERELGPVRVLYMSGYVQGEVSWRGAPGSVVGFVGKPMTPNELAVAVRELLTGGPSSGTGPESAQDDPSEVVRSSA